MKTLKFLSLVAILLTVSFIYFHQYRPNIPSYIHSTSSGKAAAPVHHTTPYIHLTTGRMEAPKHHTKPYIQPTTGRMEALADHTKSYIQPTTGRMEAPTHHQIPSTHPASNHEKFPYFKDIPDMTLTVRMSSTAQKLLEYFYCTMLRSLTLYWSSQLGNLGLILDKESKEDHKFAENLQKYQDQLGVNISVYYEPLPTNKRVLTVSKYRSRGYNRQLYSSFIMDKFISTPIVAWIDTDGKFTTPVTRDNILTGNKLRVKGMNTFQYSWIGHWDNCAEKMIGKRMPSDFMTFFPVYIWRDTITNCRNYILKYLNVSTWEEAYIQVGSQDSGIMSPVNIIMTYAYYFEKGRYDWHIDIGNVDLKKYNKLHLIPGHELTSPDLTPDFHVTLHDKYYKDDKNKVNRQAYCAAVDNTVLNMEQNIKQMCEPFKTNVMWVLFEFCNKVRQEHLTTWCKNKNKYCSSMIKEHYVKTRQLVNKGVYNLDLKKFKMVEEAANFHKIKCQPFL
ncbi:hypothetical protein SNE40_013532 [Patella caerulea]|uniref:Uncharacterized protein n=1 Tax=Patella caerulea TaxID=87958 RepID=A0AAN8PNT4_PATCE